MKIVHCNRAFFVGGIESMVLGLSNAMCVDNDVSVCSIYKPNPDSIVKHLDARVHILDCGETDFNGKPIKGILRFCKFVKRGNFDVVHIHDYFYQFFLAILLYHKKTTFVYTLHSDAYHEGTVWDRRFIKLKKYCFQKGWLHPVSISDSVGSSFNKLYGFPSKVIYNGVAFPRENTQEKTASSYRVTPETMVFVHIGRITPAKNQVVLCRVFSRLVSEGEDVALVIAGSKENEDIFDSILPFFSERICYIGQTDYVGNLFKDASALCMPSIFEGFGLAIVEGYALGCIPICTPVGGMMNIVTDGYNGILASSVSEDDYYDAVRRFLLMSNSERDIMRDNCKKCFAGYSIDKTADEYLTYYRELAR